jgi:RNA recognition motif-containing protein
MEHRKPQNGAQIFVGCLPANFDERELYNYFSQFAKIENLSIKYRSNKVPSGHGSFTCLEPSKLSYLLEQSHIFKGRRIEVRPSLEGEEKEAYQREFNERRLYIGNLPPDVEDEELYQYFCRFGEIDRAYKANRPDRAGNTFGFVILSHKKYAHFFVNYKDFYISGYKIEAKMAERGGAENIKVKGKKNKKRKREIETLGQNSSGWMRSSQKNFSSRAANYEDELCNYPSNFGNHKNLKSNHKQQNYQKRRKLISKNRSLYQHSRIHPYCSNSGPTGSNSFGVAKRQPRARQANHNERTDYYRKSKLARYQSNNLRNQHLQRRSEEEYRIGQEFNSYHHQEGRAFAARRIGDFQSLTYRQILKKLLIHLPRNKAIFKISSRIRKSHCHSRSNIRLNKRK